MHPTPGRPAEGRHEQRRPAHHFEGAAPSAPGRVVDLEGYRGVAALGVLVFHCYQFCRGGPTFDYAYRGTAPGYLLMALDSLVDLFLVLSAFLLYGPVVRRLLAERPQPSARAFLLRRAVRLLPLYWVAILLVWATRNGRLPGYWVDLLEHLTFTQVYDSRYIFWTIGPAWSLAVEIHFYVLLAVVMLALDRIDAHRLSRRARLAIAWGFPAVLLVASGVWNLAALSRGVPFQDWATWFNPLAKAFTFAAGMALAVLHTLLRDRLPLPIRQVWAMRAGGLALLVLSAAAERGGAAAMVTHHAETTIAYALLLASSVLAPEGGAWRRALAHPVLLWFGAVSYSIYLWHEPVLLWLDNRGLVSHQESALPGVVLTLLVTAIPVAALSHYVLERPFARLRTTFDDSGRRRDYYEAGALEGPARREPGEAADADQTR